MRVSDESENLGKLDTVGLEEILIPIPFALVLLYCIQESEKTLVALSECGLFV